MLFIYKLPHRPLSLPLYQQQTKSARCGHRLFLSVDRYFTSATPGMLRSI